MARRKRKKKSAQSNPLPMIIGAAVAVGVLVLLYLFITSRGKGQNFQVLPAQQFQNNPSSLRGSDFSVTGKIKEKMHHSDSLGTIVSIEIVEDGEVYRFPFRIPKDVDGPNLSAEQNYIFNGSVNTKGRFIVSSYEDK